MIGARDGDDVVGIRLHGDIILTNWYEVRRS